MAESLDGGVGPLLEVVVVARHVEGREGRPAGLHGARQGAGRQRHPQPAVGRQRALDGVGQGGRAGAHGGRQRLRVLEAGEAGGGGDPGAQGEVVGGGERRGCGGQTQTLAGKSQLSSPRVQTSGCNELQRRPTSAVRRVSVLAQGLLVGGVGPDGRAGVRVLVDQVLHTLPAAEAKDRAPM